MWGLCVMRLLLGRWDGLYMSGLGHG
jgi:hypothetical protein